MQVSAPAGEYKVSFASLGYYDTTFPVQLQGIIPKHAYTTFLAKVNEIARETEQEAKSHYWKMVLGLVGAPCLLPLALYFIGIQDCQKAIKNGQERVGELVAAENRRLQAEIPDRQLQWVNTMENEVYGNGRTRQTVCMTLQWSNCTRLHFAVDSIAM
eukprot:TRINITY_DN112669_c0_g1_i1.p1 TRINITY_DN112669_c0_g1~~TRINITY_DN112669_c0_g1_i1.p1  ORF type:complete len:158 (+),score=5.09 TRINITY_DN112669_c0_g1_i1:101-574(+)